MESDHAPGCYRNLRPLPEESFLGFALRLSSANEYAGVADLFASTLAMPRASVSANPARAALTVRSDSSLLSVMGRVAAGDAALLARFALKELADEALIFQGTRVDTDAWLGDAAQVCPLCLAQHGNASEDWDLAPVAVCPEHKVALLDTCAVCGTALSWQRSMLNRCANCSADLSQMVTVEVDDAACIAACDFASLAQFRLRLHDGTAMTVTWDAGFRLLKSLSLNLSHFREQHWPVARWFGRLDVRARLDCLQALATVRRNGAYDLWRLRTKFLEKLACLDAIPKPGVAANWAFPVLHSGAGLPRAVAGSLSRVEAVNPPLTGARRFGGRPPSLHSRGEAEGFLAVDATAFNALLQRRLVNEPVGDMAYDIDELIGSQAYLADRLLTVQELERLVGVPLDWSDLHNSSLLQRWNPGSGMDLRVDVDQVCSLQLRLMEGLAGACPPSAPVTAGELVAPLARPFFALCALVALVLNRGLTQYRWGYPYTWESLVLDRDEVSRIANTSAQTALTELRPAAERHPSAGQQP